MNIEVILRELLPKACFGGVKLQRKNRLASNGRRFVTRPLFWQDRRTPGNPRNFFYTHDGNKNVSEVVSYSAANGLAAHYEYSPFGETLVAESCGLLASDAVAANNPWRFSSEYLDSVLCCRYYNFRHLNPMVAQWLVRDFLQAGEVINLYGYCLNDPILLFDALGLKENVPIPGTPYYGRVEVQIQLQNSCAQPIDGIYSHVDVMDDKGVKIVSLPLDLHGDVVGTRENTSIESLGKKNFAKIQEWAKPKGTKLAQSIVSRCKCPPPNSTGNTLQPPSRVVRGTRGVSGRGGGGFGGSARGGGGANPYLLIMQPYL